MDADRDSLAPYSLCDEDGKRDTCQIPRREVMPMLDQSWLLRLRAAESLARSTLIAR
jgi:hypothetical protein